MKLGLLLVLVSLGCGGEDFTSAAVMVAPDSGGVADSPVAATDGVDRRTASEPSASDAMGEGPPPIRDVLADPWPDDVEVEPVDAPQEAGCLNCMYRGDLGTDVCCNMVMGGCFGKLSHCDKCTCSPF